MVSFPLFSLLSLAVFLNVIVDASTFPERSTRENSEGCFDCTLLNRFGPSNCAKTPFECFRCLPGFRDVPVTYKTGKLKKPCVKDKATPTVVSNHADCASDRDCILGRFCFENKYCVSCLDCAIFNRERNPSVNCAKKIPDCGACLPGSVETVAGLGLKPCQQLAVTSPQTATQYESGIYFTGIIIMSLMMVFGGGVLVYFFINYARNRSSPAAASEEILPNEAPPPYKPDDDQQSELVCGFFKQPPEEECTARVFRRPTYNVTVNTPQYTAESVPSDIDNEETIACPWRPSPEGASHSDVNFLGRFNAIRARPAEDAANGPAPKRQK